MAKKRANGEGNIRKRSDGRWEGRYTAGYHPDTGKRIIKNVLGRTQAEVKAKLKKAIEEAGSLDVAKAGKYTVAEWLRLWFEVYAKPNLRFSTAEYYRRGIELHTIPYIGEVKLNHLGTHARGPSHRPRRRGLIATRRWGIGTNAGAPPLFVSHLSEACSNVQQWRFALSDAKGSPCLREAPARSAAPPCAARCSGFGVSRARSR